jgi:hypothetical protein
MQVRYELGTNEFDTTFLPTSYTPVEVKYDSILHDFAISWSFIAVL